MMQKFGLVLKKQFISGLLVTVPLMVTYFILRFLFSALDGLLNPIMRDLFGYNIPGLGAVVTILLILLAGIVTTNYIGARIFKWSDGFLGRAPFVRIVYTAAKQLIQSMVAPKERAFSEVAFIEYPRKGMFAIGFLSGKCDITDDNQDRLMRPVFIPSTPTPFTGLVVFLPVEDVYPVDMGVEEAIKVLVSGGIVTPPKIIIERQSEKREVANASGEYIG
ncbi:MAG: DUF502 domain-containing protein [candidate division Zixibacteria bacterium]|nr:DUF502 domain-containing protein [candidate division Zixibacteria bacterium]